MHQLQREKLHPVAPQLLQLAHYSCTHTPKDFKKEILGFFITQHFGTAACRELPVMQMVLIQRRGHQPQRLIATPSQPTSQCV
jgi:hypothetical protein